MTPVGFNDQVHTFSSPEPRAKADDQRSVVDSGSRVLLGQDGIYHHIRFQFSPDGSLGVDDYGNFSPFPSLEDFCSTGDPSTYQALNFFLTLEDGFAEGHFPAHRQGLLNLGYANAETGAGQAMNQTRAHLTSPFDQDDQVL
jgi:hypothetical protein